MKKSIKSFIVIAAAALTLAGCQKKEIEQPVQNEGGYKYSFAIVDDTRAVIGDSNVEWVSGDRVGMFVGDYKGYANVDVTTTPKMVVLYSNTAIPAGTMAYAYAPYDPENKEGDPDMVKIVVNNIQNGAQTSAMPLAGLPFEVEEEIDPKAQEGNGQIRFMNLGSLINFKIFSSEEDFQNETIQYIEFESDKALAGVGYIDLTAVDMDDETSLELLMDTEENVVKVAEEMPVAADKEEAEPIKMVILPGTFSGTLTVVTDVATYTKDIPEREFARSHSRTFGLDLAKAEREEGVVEVVKTLPYEEAFTANQGDFEIKNVTLPEGQTNLWVFDSQYGAKVTAYISGTNYASETWLISPWLDLTEVANAAVTFDHAGNYFSNATAIQNECTLWAMSDEEGAEWEQLPIGKYFSSWTFVNAGEISLSDYVGGKVKVAFKYTSTSTKAGTWEIKNFKAYALKGDPGLAFGDGSIVIEATVDDEEIEVPELTNPHNLEVTYSSSNEDVALVDETGYVLLMGEVGTAIITASFAGNDNFEAGEASYKIKVTDPSAGKVYYTKVTSTEDVTEGQYLIVYEGNSTHDAVAFDGSLSSLDVASNGIAVTIVDSQIEQTEQTTASEFTIATKDGGFSVKSASGLYIGSTSYANGMKTSDSDDYTNGITIDGSGNAEITVTLTGGTVTLKYNYASDQLRFRYYKSGQQSIALYKLD